MVDEGQAVHYTAVTRGTPVYSADGVEVGRVEAILDNYREHIFDGVVFADGRGKLRFADAPEVARTAERAVVLAIDAEQAQQLGAPEKDQLKPRSSRGGLLSRLFGGGWKRQ